MIKKHKSIILLLFVYAIIAALTIIFFNGTGGDGDSVTHYLFAKYAPAHPELFFDHWAKPVFVLLSSPFAQFGFVGMKVFNVLITILTIFFTYRTAGLLNLKNEILSALFLIFSPLYFILTFSGLTEPLFALFTILGVYLALKQRFIAAAVIISFLPFVRSEGLIIAGVFGFYFLLKKKWNLLPLLLTGHIVYSIAGYFVYHDLLWVFTKIPYNNLGSPYGSGKLFHFVNELLYVTGIPLYALFWTGFVFIIYKFFKKEISPEVGVLIFLGFIAFFVAHSLFWYLGIFNSMGLKRVLIGVIPLISLIALYGFNFVYEILIRNLLFKRIAGAVILLYVFIFPFTHNPAAINWEKDMKLSNKQQLAKEVAKVIINKKGKGNRYAFSYTYLSLVFNIDYFDKEKRVELTNEYLKQIRKNDIIIWDDWFSKYQRKISLISLDKNPELQKILLFKSPGNKEVVFSTFIGK